MTDRKKQAIFKKLDQATYKIWLRVCNMQSDNHFINHSLEVPVLSEIYITFMFIMGSVHKGDIYGGCLLQPGQVEVRERQ